MANYELVIENENDCESNVDFINDIKKRLEFIESILKVKVKKIKKQNHQNGNEVQKWVWKEIVLKH